MGLRTVEDLKEISSEIVEKLEDKNERISQIEIILILAMVNEYFTDKRAMEGF